MRFSYDINNSCNFRELLFDVIITKLSITNIIFLNPPQKYIKYRSPISPYISQNGHSFYNPYKFNDGIHGPKIHPPRHLLRLARVRSPELRVDSLLRHWTRRRMEAPPPGIHLPLRLPPPNRLPTHGLGRVAGFPGRSPNDSAAGSLRVA